jgi:hypothetical protein
MIIEYQLLSSIINYFHQLTIIIINYQLLPLTIIINYYHQLSTIIIDYQQLSSIINYYHQLSTIIINYQLLSIIIHYYSFNLSKLLPETSPGDVGAMHRRRCRCCLWVICRQKHGWGRHRGWVEKWLVNGL